MNAIAVLTIDYIGAILGNSSPPLFLSVSLSLRNIFPLREILHEQ